MLLSQKITLRVPSGIWWTLRERITLVKTMKSHILQYCTFGRGRGLVVKVIGKGDLNDLSSIPVDC